MSSPYRTPNTKRFRRNLVCNELKSLRRPALIVQVSSEQDVVEAVRFARKHRLPVAVRGGGRSWAGSRCGTKQPLVDVGSPVAVGG
jgi:FAD/FMN-containing dehydrogenase